MLRHALQPLLVAFIISISGCSNSPQAQVAVLVELPRPSGVTNEALDRGFTDTAGDLRDIPGLKRKYFTYSDSHFGGVYLWESSSAAESFFTQAWQERISTEYGSKARLTYFDTPALTPGGSHGTADADSIVTIVRVSAPWYAPRSLIVDRMEASIPFYQTVSGLDYKYFTIADEKQVGGIYLWRDSDSADAFYNAAWHKRIRDSYGEAADIARFHSSVHIMNQ